MSSMRVGSFLFGAKFQMVSAAGCEYWLLPVTTNRPNSFNSSVIRSGRSPST
ncbi:hypothetical protein M758_2G045000 [Ceratodon purpureus]|nr:hypothetical protein M758_2G045000 [Ceratodon purpureus]